MRLLVVHHPQASASLTEIGQSVPDGVDVHVLFRSEIAAASPALVQVSRMVYPTTVSGEDPSEVTVDGFDAVLTFADPELDFTDVLRRRLWGKESVVEDAWSKSTQREVFGRAGLTRLRFGVAHDAGQLRDLVRHVQNPLVFKPLRGAGGDGVYRYDSASRPIDLDWCPELGWPIHVESAIPALPTHPHQGWMSSMFSVEMATDAAGTHTPVAVFGKVPVETRRSDDALECVRVCGDVLPSGLGRDDEDRLIRATAQALTALGVTRRLTHTELFLTADGPEIVEINGRMGGYLARVLRVTGGADLVATTIRTALGYDAVGLATSCQGSDTPSQDARPVHYEAAAGFFPSGPLELETVRSSVIPRQLRELPDVVLVESHARHGLPWAQSDRRMVNLVIGAEDHAQLGAALSSTRDAIRSLYQADFVEEDQR